MAETLALALAGVVGMFAAQLFKRYTHLNGTPMAWMTMLISLIIATIATLLVGDVTLSGLLGDPMLFYGGGGVVMTVATLVYQSIKDKMDLGG